MLLLVISVKCVVHNDSLMYIFALQVLSVAVYNHYKRLYHASEPKRLDLRFFSLLSYCM